MLRLEKLLSSTINRTSDAPHHRPTFNSIHFTILLYTLHTTSWHQRTSYHILWPSDAPILLTFLYSPLHRRRPLPLSILILITPHISKWASGTLLRALEPSTGLVAPPARLSLRARAHSTLLNDKAWLSEQKRNTLLVILYVWSKFFFYFISIRWNT